MAEDGIEVGDDGKFVQDLEDDIDMNLFMQKLSPKQQEIAQMLLDGYKQVEIAQKLGVDKSAVSHIKERIKRQLLA